MEVTALCFMLLMLEFPHLRAQVWNNSTPKSDADFLSIDPNRLQHFLRDPVSFDCGGSHGSNTFRLLNGTNGVKCSPKKMQGSICTVYRIYQEDNGDYWCETDGGERSNTVTITVTDGAVILESPALPVTEGDSVTMRCRNKTSSLPADFYKDDIIILGSPAAEMTINSVSKSDEGVYKCNISGVGGSLGSWLTVRANIISRSPCEESCPSLDRSVLIILHLRTVFTIVLVSLQLLLLGLLHRGKLRVT